ncbi:IclR family transcriptional regulator [Streptomyces sp. NPDC090442]|uniref:IclR family transcriptional regulator n=1 Tax=Streptomyces sp. NPDC090442 TaxID=3365962 RepID=UPI003810A1DA
MNRTFASLHRAVSALRVRALRSDDRRDEPPQDCNCLRAAAMVWADELAMLSGMSVRITVAHPRGVQVIHHVFRPDNSPQRLTVGEVLPHDSAPAHALDLPHDGRCVCVPEPDLRMAELATVIPCPETPHHAAALSLTGPADLLDLALGASDRYRRLLNDTALSIRLSLTAGTPTRA